MKHLEQLSLNCQPMAQSGLKGTTQPDMLKELAGKGEGWGVGSVRPGGLGRGGGGGGLGRGGGGGGPGGERSVRPGGLTRGRGLKETTQPDMLRELAGRGRGW